MVRGNWQRRVEKTEARRAAAKQRKQKRDNRSAYKAMVHELMSLFDEHADAIKRRAEPNWVVHIWTDSIPSDSPPILDICESGGGKQRRNRSGSIGSEPNRKGRKRSNSTSETPVNNKKKNHPRSNKDAEPIDEEIAFSPKLCMNQFYRGKCDDLRSKKGGCRWVHLSGPHKTLHNVLKEGKGDSRDAKEVLGCCIGALVETIVEEGGSSDDVEMDMLYYSSFTPFSNETPDAESPSLGETISKCMAGKSCSIGSIVYLAVNDLLVFDRYRGGLVVSDNTLLVKLVGETNHRARGLSTTSEGDQSVDSYAGAFLSGPILEYILTFLPDKCVAPMLSVCHQWNTEIGTNSPALWRHLLERRNWPIPSHLDHAVARDRLRDQFVVNYRAVRDINAIRDGLAGLSSSRKTIEEKEMVYHQFDNRRFAPHFPNICIALEVWSANQVLAAYTLDCSIRLFKAVHKAGDGGNNRACRELVSVCVDPFRRTKKKNCQLVAMALDEEVIGCMCHVETDGSEKEGFLLCVVSRDDFLCAAGGSSGNDAVGWSVLEEDALKTIDIGEAAINYLLSCDEVDHRLLRFLDFLADGGDISEVEVLVSQTIAACGYGRFLLEVSISIPVFNDAEGDDNDDVNIVLVDRKLMLLSSSVGAIIWVGDSTPTNGNALHRYEELSLASMRFSPSGGTRIGCSMVAALPTQADKIVRTEIEPSGHVHCVRTNSSIDPEHQLDIDGDWEVAHYIRRPVAMTAEAVVVAHMLFKQLDLERREYRSILYFYPRLEESEAPVGAVLLDGNFEVVHISPLRAEHVVAFGRMHTSNNDDLAMNGQWFMDAPEPVDPDLWAIIVHVPTKRVIHRVCVLEGCPMFVTPFDLPFFMSSLGDTVGVCAWWKGIVITGKDVRDIGYEAMPSDADAMSPASVKQQKKKKKKRQPNRGGKKDAFARGMSMRG